MPPTLETARTVVRERLGESRARAWSDNELDRWIYEGCKDVARATEVLQTETTLAVDAGIQKVTMPTDIIRSYRVEWRTDGETQVHPLEFRDFNNADAVWWTAQETTQGRPILYTMWGVPPSLNLVLYPTPVDDGELKFFYYRMPTTFAAQVAAAIEAEEATPANIDQATLDIPEGWEDTVYLYAEMCALRRDRDSRWQEAKSLYQEQLDTLFNLTRRFTDQSGQVIGGGNYPAINGWLYGDDVAWG